MARLQELQYTVSGGTKVISGVSLSPRSTRGYIKTSLRCKQESLRYARKISVPSLLRFLGLVPEMGPLHLSYCLIKIESFLPFSYKLTNFLNGFCFLPPFVTSLCEKVADSCIFCLSDQ